ncbi:hypothetical protein [Glycomyces arizonensis]|uniref:hypothetical protein n=1 Tax=Glycomyces arizonensis TaxID=256035 RepID=UPI0012EB0AAF|nr:hypothetical protein [Glycomyces arizonensis]
MRRVVIAAAAVVAVLGVAGCSSGDEEEPETPDAGAEQEGSTPPSVADEWESAGDLDNMPAEAAAALEPPISTQAVVDVLMEAGLSDGEFTDLGADVESCDITDCTQAFTIGEEGSQATVMLYMTAEMAAAAAEEIGEAHAEGSVVLHYGPNGTPEDVQAEFETALADGLAE